ncbi:homoprotocatechuate degradation operon regulator HpaR [Pseudomonas mosselii]|uniref:homoprotocatechuate degradation operon regulator HpaR n=1 Tax=Pseudomonas mosselii TaxID=78327 RepID=UPI00164955AA|nr:homoprotocatechuate degradation operon regulator HpaR [Pseudomonas mosselii]MBC3457003.1 homoprotocatechuate degradation operon regulator HpaR [Pseudomonas mosselii]
MIKFRPSLTLNLLQAREVAMRFFRPSLKEYGLTEQQWRVIRILHEQGPIEILKLADLACILGPSMTGVVSRMQNAGLVVKRKVHHDQRIVLVDLTVAGLECFDSMSARMNDSYLRLQDQLGEEKLEVLLGLLNDLKHLKR